MFLFHAQHDLLKITRLVYTREVVYLPSSTQRRNSICLRTLKKISHDEITLALKRSVKRQKYLSPHCIILRDTLSDSSPSATAAPGLQLDLVGENNPRQDMKKGRNFALV